MHRADKNTFSFTLFSKGSVGLGLGFRFPFMLTTVKITLRMIKRMVPAFGKKAEDIAPPSSWNSTCHGIIKQYRKIPIPVSANPKMVSLLKAKTDSSLGWLCLCQKAYRNNGMVERQIRLTSNYHAVEVGVTRNEKSGFAKALEIGFIYLISFYNQASRTKIGMLRFGF